MSDGYGKRFLPVRFESKTSQSRIESLYVVSTSENYNQLVMRQKVFFCIKSVTALNSWLKSLIAKWLIWNISLLYRLLLDSSVKCPNEIYLLYVLQVFFIIMHLTFYPLFQALMSCEFRNFCINFHTFARSSHGFDFFFILQTYFLVLSRFSINVPL